jgi:predicted outer membrane repeat protein
VRWRSRLLGVLVGLVGLVGAPLGVIVLTSSPAGALMTFTVDKAGPDPAVGSAANCPVVPAGTCTLRDAFVAANGTPDDVQINIPASLSPITLSTGNVLAYTGTHALTLTGTGGTATITQKAAATQGVITDTSGAGLLTVQNLTITGGNIGGDGGGIAAFRGLTLLNSTVTGNTATVGCGGVNANGTVTVTNSTITNNTATEFGGGICGSGSMTVTNSTITNNTANGAPGSGGIEGGGIEFSGNVTLVYVTDVNNTAKLAGGGSNVDLNNGGRLTSFASVVAIPLGLGTNCANMTGTTSHGFNFSDDASSSVSCHFNDPTDRVGSTDNPNLGGLANNGGSTQTLLPQSGSPLIDAIPNAHCQDQGAITTDQRGLARPSPSGGSCDIGAVEVQQATPPTPVVITPKFTG